MNAFWNTTRKLTAIAGLTVALSAPALAQSSAGGGTAPTPSTPTPPAAKRKLEGDFSKPLGAARARAESSGGSSNYTLIQNDGDNSLKLTVKDGDVQAEVNGKPVPAERIKRDGDQITILDENGNTIGNPIQIGGQVAGFDRVFGGVGGNDPVFSVFGGQPSEPPPVMMGVTMSEADEKVMEALGIKDEDGAIQLDTVRDGLPAAKAGLQARDLIVEINGQKPATQEKLREILKNAKPGDELKLKVMRKGQGQDFTIKLEKFDAMALGRPRVVEDGALHSDPLGGGVTTWRQADTEAVRKAIEEAMKTLHEKAANIDTEKIRAEATESLQKALEALKESQSQYGNAMRRYMVAPSAPRAAARGNAFSTPDGMVFQTAPGVESGKRIQALEEKVDQLQKSIDQLMKKLDEKNK